MKKILIIASMLTSVSFADIAKPVAAPKTAKPTAASKKMSVAQSVWAAAPAMGQVSVPAKATLTQASNPWVSKADSKQETAASRSV